MPRSLFLTSASVRAAGYTGANDGPALSQFGKGGATLSGGQRRAYSSSTSVPVPLARVFSFLSGLFYDDVLTLDKVGADSAFPLHHIPHGRWAWADTPNEWPGGQRKLPPGALSVWSFNAVEKTWRCLPRRRRPNNTNRDRTQARRFIGSGSGTEIRPRKQQQRFEVACRPHRRRLDAGTLLHPDDRRFEPYTAHYLFY